MTLIETFGPAVSPRSLRFKTVAFPPDGKRDRWAYLMRVMQVQGFSDHNGCDVSFAAAILCDLGLNITDSHQIKRLLHVLHYLYVPNVVVTAVDSQNLDNTHRKTLRELLEIQPAFGGLLAFSRALTTVCSSA